MVRHSPAVTGLGQHLATSTRARSADVRMAHGRHPRLIAAIVVFAAGGLLPSLAGADSAQALGLGSYHACVITSGGGVECWGQNTYGELGDGTTVDRTTAVGVSGLTGTAIDVAAGTWFTCSVNDAGALSCWGLNSYGQLGDGTTTNSVAPQWVSGLTSGVQQVVAGRYHACALTTAGGVKCWGYNYYGQLGDGTTTQRLTPVNVSGLTSGVASVSAGAYHTCAVTTAGAVRCWGYNLDGQLGDGTATNRSTPVTVSGLSSGGFGVGAGYYHSCALRTSGGVECWGDNDHGQLGDGTTTDRLTPVAVSGLTSGVAWLSVGSHHACVVTSTGGAKCWGNGTYGRLGDGSTTDRTTPTDVSGLTSGVATVVGGGTFGCATTAAGGVKCWGRNLYGQLGDGTTTDRTTPVDVSGFSGSTGAVAAGAGRVASGYSHSCVVTNAGGVKCWGYNNYGQLGNGNSAGEEAAPVDVHGLTSGVAAVTVGESFSCALTTGGAVRCWGANPDGQLGDGTSTNRPTPVAVSGLASGVTGLSAGRFHACAVTSAGGVKCWGNNQYGQIGDGTTTNRRTPVNVSGHTSGVSSVSSGGYHTCLVTTAGGVKCWGHNISGQLGNGTTVDSPTSVWVSGLSSGVAAASAGNYSTCAMTTAGGLKCWGRNSVGQLGDGTTTDRSVPGDVSGLTTGVSAMAGQYYHVCAVTTSGALKCWGYNDYGQVGDGTTTHRSTPVAASGLTGGVTAVAGGYLHTCAVTSRGGVQCWGDNSVSQLGDGTLSGSRRTPGWVTGLVGGEGLLEGGHSHGCRVTAAGGVQCWGRGSQGQLGDGTTADHRTPVDVSGLATGVVAVAVGGEFSCALTSAGGVKCWGDNADGQLGDGTTTDRTTPVDVSGLTSGVAVLAAGDDHACAVTAAGALACWGDNGYGQIGDGTYTERSSPVWVSGLSSGVVGAAAGVYHTCAVMAGGAVKCWGWNNYGQLGNGSTTTSPLPVAVSGLASGVSALTAGYAHSCALTTSGGAKCWGYNVYGQLGDGTGSSRTAPVDVTGLTSGVAGVEAGRQHTCAVTHTGALQCWGYNAYGQLGDGTLSNRTSPVAVPTFSTGGGTVATMAYAVCAVTEIGGAKCWGDNDYGQLADGTERDRTTPVTLRGFPLDDDFDGDVKADVSVFRPSTGTWFSLDSSSGNASYQSRGWGVQAQGDTAAPGDFDGDGVVDPTVFRPSTGTWFILESSSSYTTWDYFGWGATGDTLVPADYDGDGKTDGAVYRASTGTWYIRPSSGAAQWNVVFGVSTDVPIPGHWDSDGKADIAVYRPSTGTWFVLTSSSGYTSYWYRGWGINAQGDSPAPGDYDGDGRLDLCVFRPGTGTWFILESHANFTTWNWFGWGGSGDTLVPTDFDGDGITDAAVYRPSTYTWYVRPSSGATQWNVVFGASGDVPLITIR